MSIFVSIASYSDVLLGHTINDAIKKSKYPNDLFFGVVEQSELGKRIKITPDHKNVRYLGVNPHESRGACWARSVCMSMYNDEDWFFQIDAHMIFEQDWDERFVKAAEKCAEISPKFIVSSYPNSYERENGIVTKHIFRGTSVHIIADDFDPKNSKLKFVASPVDTTDIIPGVHVGAGCLFTLGKFVYEIPYDPYMYFNGEEQAIALRAYTHGWDMFHVPDMPIYHLYAKSKGGERPRHWDKEVTTKRAEHWATMQQRATDRLEALIHGKDMGIYGLGSVRSVQDYIDFSGVDYFNKKAKGRASRLYWDKQQTMEEKFTKIFEKKGWGSGETVSGPSSTLKHTERLRQELPKLFEQFEIKSVFDAPCGDLNWMAKVLEHSDIDYVGADIVQALIEELKEKYKDNPKMKFVYTNLVEDKYPMADLMLCRDFLFHMPYVETYKVLTNFVESGIKYLFTTSHMKRPEKPFENHDISAGSFRYMDLFASPYNFPEDTLFKVLDGFEDRHMFLWSREQIQKVLEHEDWRKYLLERAEQDLEIKEMKNDKSD